MVVVPVGSVSAIDPSSGRGGRVAREEARNIGKGGVARSLVQVGDVIYGTVKSIRALPPRKTSSRKPVINDDLLDKSVVIPKAIA